MAPYPAGDVSANGISLHYYRSTPYENAPSVVLLHGLTDNGLCWTRLADALCDRYDVIMPDTRGHGFSDKPEEGYGIIERAADVAGLIDALGLDRPVLMGHSLGGQAATAVAGLYPELVRGIILEDPAWFERQESLEEMHAKAEEWGAGLRHSQGLERAALIAECQQNNPTWAQEEIEPWADAHSQMSPQALVKILTTFTGDSWRGFLRQAQCPILLITAEPQRGSIITPEMVAEAARLWKDGREAHIPDAGHCIHREQFAPVLAAVEAFLREVFAG